MILVALTHGFKFQILIWAQGKLWCERNLSANPSQWGDFELGVGLLILLGLFLMSATHLILPQKSCRSGPFVRYKYWNFVGQKWHDVNALMWVLMKSTSAMISFFETYPSWVPLSNKAKFISCGLYKYSYYLSSFFLENWEYNTVSIFDYSQF